VFDLLGQVGHDLFQIHPLPPTAIPPAIHSSQKNPPNP
jgi:hypothetical protein